MTITLEMLTVQVAGLQCHDLDRWIQNDWVRPDGPDGHYVFHDIDVERVRLILVLQNEMQVNEDALPVVLSLLDQLYELRRRLSLLTVQQTTA